MPLPPGYSTTSAAGLRTLWRDGHCVTVQSADIPETVLERIAERYDRCHTAVSDADSEDTEKLVTITEIARKLGLPRQTVALRLRKAHRNNQIMHAADARGRRPARYCWQDVLAIPKIANPARVIAPPTGRTTTIIEARRAGRTLQEIADTHGLSRERVRQILERAAERSGAPLGRPCNDCGTILTGRPARRGLCHRCTARRARERTCKHCGARFTPDDRTHTYCPACRTETRPCAACGRPITRDRGRDGTYFKNAQWFCDKHCQGHWLGTHHGRSRRNAS